jgi:hypothetical protein
MKSVKTALFTFLLISLTVGTAMPIKTHAQSNNLIIEDLWKQIDFLQSLLNSLTQKPVNAKVKNGAVLQETESEAGFLAEEYPYIKIKMTSSNFDGKPSIKIIEPKKYSKFAYPNEGESTFDVSWKTENIPPNSVIVWEHKFIRIYDNITGAGGSGYSAMPAGDSTITRIQRFGKTLQSPGEYKVRGLVRQCHSDGCEVNPDFKGQEEDLEIYAVSEWHYYTLGNIDTKFNKTSEIIKITNIKPQDISLPFNSPIRLSWKLAGVPKGDYLVCVLIEDRDKGGKYVPEPCKKAKNGTGSMYWTPTGQWWTNKYRVDVRILDEDEKTGRDRRTLVEDQGDWFDLNP